MSKITVKSLLIICLAIIPLTFFGQNNGGNKQKTNDNHVFMDVDLGASFLFGDNETFQFNRMRGDMRIGAGYAFYKYFTAYGKIGFGFLSGQKENLFKTNMSTYLSYDLNVSVDLVNLIMGYSDDRALAVKPHVGIGQLQSQARATAANGQMYKYGYVNSEAGVTEEGKGFGGRNIYLEIPMGIEFEYNPNRKCAFYFDLQTNYVDSDKLDGFMHGDHKDWYSIGNIGVRYKFRDARSAKQIAAEQAAAAKAAKEAEEAAAKAAEEAANRKPDCEACEEVIKKAVKEAVEEALKNCQPAQQAVEAEGDDADQTEALEVIKRNFDEKDIHLTFKAGKAEVVDNAANRDEVKKISDDIENGRQISTIKTLGWASPEGTDKQNQKLSEERAQATANYIKSKLGNQANGINFDVQGMGSDWSGFYKALDNSNIADKAQIANDIKGSKNPTATLNQLKDKNPELKKLLVELRKTQVFINK